VASSIEAYLLAQATFLQNPPRFRGSILAATALGTGANVGFTTISEDNYGGWNGSGHFWAVPVAGLYYVSVQFKWGTTTPSSAPSTRVQGGPGSVTALLQSPNATGITSFLGIGVDGFVRCAVADQLCVQILNAGFTSQNDSPADNNYMHVFFVSQ
jgi:hypothetical protein